MSVVTISLSDSIAATLRSRAEAAGLSSTEEYLLALVRADCEQAELESISNPGLMVLQPRWGVIGNKKCAARLSVVAELRLERHPAVIEQDLPEIYARRPRPILRVTRRRMNLPVLEDRDKTRPPPPPAHRTKKRRDLLHGKS